MTLVEVEEEEESRMLADAILAIRDREAVADIREPSEKKLKNYQRLSKLCEILLANYNKTIFQMS